MTSTDEAEVKVNEAQRAIDELCGSLDTAVARIAFELVRSYSTVVERIVRTAIETHHDFFLALPDDDIARLKRRVESLKLDTDRLASRIDRECEWPHRSMDAAGAVQRTGSSYLEDAHRSVLGEVGEILIAYGIGDDRDPLPTPAWCRDANGSLRYASAAALDPVTAVSGSVTGLLAAYAKDLGRLISLQSERDMLIVQLARQRSLGRWDRA